ADAACRFLVFQSALRLAGLTRTPIVPALGTSSCSSSSRFGQSSPRKAATPVSLPPGRLRLATRPNATGSTPTVKTIGIVEVAALAANVEVTEAEKITVTLLATRS